MWVALDPHKGMIAPMPYRPTLALAALALLTACAGPSGPCPIQDAAPVPPAADTCRAGQLGRYLGALPTADVIAAISGMAGAQNVRTIRPGDAVTMDYRENRLNVELGEDGRIRRLRCG